MLPEKNERGSGPLAQADMSADMSAEADERLDEGGLMGGNVMDAGGSTRRAGERGADGKRSDQSDASLGRYGQIQMAARGHLSGCPRGPIQPIPTCLADLHLLDPLHVRHD